MYFSISYEESMCKMSILLWLSNKLQEHTHKLIHQLNWQSSRVPYSTYESKKKKIHPQQKLGAMAQQILKDHNLISRYCQKGRPKPC